MALIAFAWLLEKGALVWYSLCYATLHEVAAEFSALKLP